VSASQTKTDAQFRLELSLRGNPKVLPLEPYVSAHRHILCRCRSCEHEWRATPNSLLRSSGCPACSPTGGTRVPARIIEAIEAHYAGTIDVLGPILGTSKPVLCRCTCGLEWSPIPYTLLKGHGCPRCAGVLRTEQEFAEKIDRLFGGTVRIQSDEQTRTRSMPLMFV